MPDGIIHPDHLGTPQKMTDSSGTVVWAADYKPFGEATVTVSTITNNLRYPGQYYDAETGLNENWWRYYNAVIGRYPQADPIGQRGGLNIFTYAHNNPFTFIDPKGLYGTSSCTYYEQACQTNGGKYECKIVQKACNFFPKDPDDNTSNCIRQCLQEKHKKRQPPNQCSTQGQTGWGDFFTEHAECFIGCFRNSQNPYDPKGPNLPSEDVSLY